MSLCSYLATSSVCRMYVCIVQIPNNETFPSSTILNSTLNCEKFTINSVTLYNSTVRLYVTTNDTLYRYSVTSYYPTVSIYYATNDTLYSYYTTSDTLYSYIPIFSTLITALIVLGDIYLDWCLLYPP